MGVVWAGYHIDRGVPVAVKVITRRRADDLEYRSGFAREAHAVAQLDHPNIIAIYDYGTVDEESEHASGGALVRGCPYLVMELAAGDAIKREAAPRCWSDLKTALCALLAGLAHAHARGVVHRDLKPGNILLSEAGRSYSTLKLTDFGVAQALDATFGQDSEGMGMLAMGTPRYMSPEQIRGHWRDQGPWTDLYAVGCVAYRWTTGNPPFGGRDVPQILRGHLFDRVPPISPLFSVPEAFKAWIGVLLQKEPAERYTRAKDAQGALLSIGDEKNDNWLVPDGDETLTSATLVALDSGRFDFQDSFRPETAPLDLEERDEERTVASVPVALAAEDARKLAPMPPRVVPNQLPDVPLKGSGLPSLGNDGLGLFALRPPPMVGREAERTAMWEALRRVHGGGPAHALLLEGHAGTGKSRLASWLAENAHELGVAHVLWVRHEPSGTQDGLRQLLLRHFLCYGMTRAEIANRLDAVFSAWPYGEAGRDLQALTELMEPSKESDEGRYSFSSPTERYTVVNRLLSTLCHTRPVVLVLDDVQWGSDTLAFVDHVLGQQASRPSRLLILMTLQTEARSGRPLEEQQLAALLQRSDVTRVNVAPLPASTQRDLIEGLLHLEPELIRVVEAQTAGNPLYAIRLVGDWVQRGLLERTKAGFVLRDAAESVSQDLVQTWLSALERVVSSVPCDLPHLERSWLWEGLEVGACLGLSVSFDEWLLVLPPLPRSVWEQLIDEAARLQLVTRSHHSWTFAHALLRECLVDRCTRGGSWWSLNRRCAAMLEAGGRTHVESLERLVHHLLEANAFDEVLPYLERAATQRRNTSDYPLAVEHDRRTQSLLETLGVAQSDERWGMSWTRIARTFAQQGKLDDAQEHLDLASQAAEVYGWPLTKAACQWVGGTVAHKRGDPAEALRRFEAAEQGYTALGDAQGVADSVYAVAEIQKINGRLAEAEERYQKAQANFEALGDLNGLAAALTGRADVHRRRGETNEALRLLRSALQTSEEAGNRFSSGIVLNILGETARAAGDWDTAEHHYRRAAAIFRAIGSPFESVLYANIGLVLLAKDDLEGARPLLEDCIASLRHSRSRGFLPYLSAAMLPCVAAKDEWDLWDLHLQEVVSGRALGIVDHDIAWALEKGAAAAFARHEKVRGRAAIVEAITQLRGVQEEARADALAKTLESEAD